MERPKLETAIEIVEGALVGVPNHEPRVRHVHKKSGVIVYTPGTISSPNLKPMSYEQQVSKKNSQNS